MPPDAGTIEFYEANPQAFFARSVEADMASGHGEFTAMLPPGGRVLGRRLRVRAGERWMSVLCRKG